MKIQNSVSSKELNDIVDVWKIVYTITTKPDHKMERAILAEDDDFNYLVIFGHHCSCYDFDDTQWDVTTYSFDELLKLIDVYSNSNVYVERKLGEFMKKHFYFYLTKHNGGM